MLKILDLIQKIEWVVLYFLYISLHSFHDHRDALAPADARGRKSVASVAAMQFVQDSQNKARARCAQRMSKRDRTAVHVCTRTIQTEFLFHSQVLRRKRFVDFDQIDITQRQTGFRKCRACGRDWSDTHDLRFDAGIS